MVLFMLTVFIFFGGRESRAWTFWLGCLEYCKQKGPCCHVNYFQDGATAACPLMAGKQLPAMPTVTPPTPDKTPNTQV